MLVREIEEVDGAAVEEVRVVSTFPDPRLDALNSATQLCEADEVESLHTVLVSHMRKEFLADWTALLVKTEVLATAGDPPDPALLQALAAGTGASPLVAEGATGPDDLAVATLDRHAAALLVGRAGHPFRRRERAQLLALARIADRAWQLLDVGAASQASR
jgi:hypothetical protein